MTDLLPPETGSTAAPEGPAPVVRTPVIPVIMLAITTVSAIVFFLGAVLDDAGQSDEISGLAVAAWALGSLVGLLVFAWFGLLDSQRRSSGTYEEPTWRPRLVAGVLATVGWLAGSAGAVLVAEAVARR